jgi:ribonuclease E
MLIDASHEEETRVSIVHGNQVEDFDYESSTKKQLRGNIYLAKITRVEPSLQAAFVEYGGNRHGFLAFSEIHPDYYQIPAADKAALIAEEEVAVKKAIAERKARRAAEKESRKAAKIAAKEKAAAKEAEEKDPPNSETGTDAETADAAKAKSTNSDDKEILDTKNEKPSDDKPSDVKDDKSDDVKDDKSSDDHKIMSEKTAEPDEVISEKITDADDASSDDKTDSADKDEDEEKTSKTRRKRRRRKPTKDEASEAEDLDEDASDDEEDDEDDEDDEAALRIQIAKRLRHRYQIQEVIKKRQIILIQVVKEERGNKGAALTTYLSLPGRYCVLMPNTLHGGGVSRKIANVQDRRRLKKIQSGLNMPEGMACIIRTAGKGRTKPDISRDYDYLKRMWEAIRDVTLKSVAPCLIYEEGNLIKRSIRDQYTRDIDEILVEGKKGYESAKEFMEMLMPTHADKVKYYDDKIPLFHRYQVESQLDSMYNPTVQLKSGGYIVINPTEALVSIDVNSGRATKEQNIEKTAQKTNYEAAEEIARQLKLRDMAGLVVIDFIDMEDRANVRSIEKRMKDCLKTDRARIQVGRISSFGLMEMSRQRLRTGVLESSTHTCPHCEGAGVIRSVESQALHIMRMIEEEGIRNRSAKVTMHLPGSVAIYLLNNKRSDLTEFENRYDISVQIEIDNELSDSSFRMNREDSSQKQETQKPEAQNSLKLGGDVVPPSEDIKAEPVQNNDAPKRRRRKRKPVQNESQSPENSVNSEISEMTNEKTNDKDADSSIESKDHRSKRRQRRGPRRNRRTAADENTQETSNEKPSSNNNEDNAPAQAEPVQKTEQPVQKEKTTDDVKPKPRRRRAAKPKTSEENKSSNDTSDEKKPQKPRSRTRKAPTKEVVKTEGKKPSPTKTVSEKTAIKPLETKTVQTQSPKADAPKKTAPKKQGWWQRTFGD